MKNMKLPLTNKHTVVLTLIRKSLVNKGYSPTRKELSQGLEKALKIKLSRQAIDRHLFALIKKDYILINRNKGRRNINIKN